MPPLRAGGRILYPATWRGRLPPRFLPDVRRGPARSGPVSDMQVAPCSSDPVLFDSIDYRDHLEAREACLTCTLRAQCRALAGPTSSGTVGGELFRDGALVMAIAP